MTNLAAIHTEKELGITTDRVKDQCKAIIKMCDQEPGAVDSLLEQCYVELVRISMMMKGNADRARLEREKYEKQQGNRATQRQRIPDMVRRIPTNVTTPKIQQMLENMDPEELEAMMTRVNARR